MLWPNGAPGAVGEDDNLDKPKIFINLPESGNGTAVLVFPGGGYDHLATGHEGKQVAEWLNAHGMAAFVVTYRLGMRYHYPAQLQDAARALRIVRSRASEFHVDPHRVGVWGFSAGGHLASLLSTHYDKGDPNAKDPIETESSRPDFTILSYPVVTMSTTYTHMGSRNYLLGEKPEKRLVWLTSNELQVTPDTPPTFLFLTDADTAVPAENSAYYYLALRRAGVPAEMHIYQKGRHGSGLGQRDPILATYTDRLLDWMQSNGIVPKQN